jgi:hypothetical protein
MAAKIPKGMEKEATSKAGMKKDMKDDMALMKKMGKKGK